MARRTRSLAWSLWALGIGAYVAGQILNQLNAAPVVWADVSQAFAFMAIGTVGLVLALRQRSNPLGWVFLAVWDGVGLVFAFLGSYARWATVTHPGAPAGTFALWLGNWAWVPTFGIL